MEMVGYTQESLVSVEGERAPDEEEGIDEVVGKWGGS